MWIMIKRLYRVTHCFTTGFIRASVNRFIFSIPLNRSLVVLLSASLTDKLLWTIALKYFHSYCGLVLCPNKIALGSIFVVECTVYQWLPTIFRILSTQLSWQSMVLNKKLSLFCFAFRPICYSGDDNCLLLGVCNAHVLLVYHSRPWSVKMTSRDSSIYDVFVNKLCNFSCWFCFQFL